MASKKKARARAATEQPYSEESPLVFTGRCWSEEQRPRPGRIFAPALTFLVECVPWYRSSQKGRASERQMRVTIMLCGLALAVLGGSMGLALLGGVIAMVGTIVPVPEGKKLRWRKQVASLSTPRTIRVPYQVQVQYDGDSVKVLRDSTVLRRVRLGDAEGKSQLCRVDSSIALELRPRTGGQTSKIWLVSELSDVDGVDTARLRTRDPGHLSMPITVSAMDWRQMWTAIGKSEDFALPQG